MLRRRGYAGVLTRLSDADGRIRAAILGFTATGTRTASVRNRPAEQSSSPQSMSIGGGTLLNRTHIPGTLIGYRVG